MTTLIISNKEIKGIMEIVKDGSEIIEKEAKNKQVELLVCYLITLGVNLLGNMLTGSKITIRAGQNF